MDEDVEWEWAEDYKKEAAIADGPFPPFMFLTLWFYFFQGSLFT